MPTFHEVDGVKFRQTTVLIREDLREKAKDKKINLSALINKALEDKLGKK